MAGSPPDGGTLLDYLQRLCEAVERLADHFTQKTTETKKPEERSYIGQRPPTLGVESGHKNRRPQQSARS